jgi:Ca2+-transporting ATPase
MLAHAAATAAAAGTTYNPDQGEVLGLPANLDVVLTSIAEVCAVCNESKIACSSGTFRAVGAPTEASLKVNNPDYPLGFIDVLLELLLV